MKRLILAYLVLLGLGYACLSTSTFGTETKVGEGSTGDTDFTGSNTWDADGATFYWDFSKADNYVDGVVTSNFDTWTINNLTKNSGKLTIHFQSQEGGFNSGNLTGDWGQEDGTAQINYSTLRPGYWFNDIVVVTGSPDGISIGDIDFDNTPGGTWSKYVSDNKLSLRYDGSFPAGYAAAPEPSTYIMVSGLFALPLWRAFRRFRKTSVSEPLV
jgi:hypothetical protein